MSLRNFTSLEATPTRIISLTEMGNNNNTERVRTSEVEAIPTPPNRP